MAVLLVWLMAPWRHEHDLIHPASHAEAAHHICLICPALKASTANDNVSQPR